MVPVYAARLPPAPPPRRPTGLRPPMSPRAAAHKTRDFYRTQLFVYPPLSWIRFRRLFPTVPDSLPPLSGFANRKTHIPVGKEYYYAFSFSPQSLFLFFFFFLTLARFTDSCLLDANRAFKRKTESTPPPFPSPPSFFK